jgi:hypothetical protein
MENDSGGYSVRWATEGGLIPSYMVGINNSSNPMNQRVSRAKGSICSGSSVS